MFHKLEVGIYEGPLVFICRYIRTVPGLKLKPLISAFPWKYDLLLETHYDRLWKDLLAHILQPIITNYLWLMPPLEVCDYKLGKEP